MPDESPAATPTDGEGHGPIGRLFATRGRKIFAVVSGAFLATVGGTLAAWTLAFGKSTTEKAIHGTAAPLTVRVLPRGSFEDTLVILPYYVVPTTTAARPGSLDRATLRSLIDGTAQGSAWAAAHGAADGSPQIVNLELRGSGGDPVTVTGIHVTVVKRGPRVHGWFVGNVTGCGARPIRVAQVELDDPAPKADYFESDSSPAQRLALSVTRTDDELIQLVAITRRSTVDWKAEVSYSAADGTGSVVVDDHGRPFRVSSEVGSTAYQLQFPHRVRRQPEWDRGIRVC